MAESAFNLREIDGLPYYSCRAFEDLPGLRHGFSTRHADRRDSTAPALNLGYSVGEPPDRVDQNRRRFLAALDLHETYSATLKQIHSNRIHIIKEIHGHWNPPEGDALLTRTEGIAVAVLTADCLPVLIADPLKDAVAAVHSGWKGTLKQIAAETVLKMVEAFGSDPASLLVALGPGIRVCCYEVGSEVSDLFHAKHPGEGLTVAAPGQPGKSHLDLPKALQLQLLAAGIRKENIYDLHRCTCCSNDMFFSYRAEGAHAGRMMAAIGRVKSGT